MHVANKIAAGEVIERPSSVVKELVENSIDAGAKNIRVSIVKGGRTLISVQDDGCGMERDDAIMSLERQATSKIRDVGDIEKIDTLGFRGEAIPSIASVSRFSMTTRTAQSDEATSLVVNAGTLAEIRSAGSPPGTIVEVRDLFCNVPARRKFLRAYATEEAHVRHVFTIHALAHPDIGFSLSIDGRETASLPRSEKTADRIADLFGPEFAERLIPFDRTWESGGKTVRVHGFIERPDVHEFARRDQFTFVNSRPATSPSIAYALREAYPRRQGDMKPATIMFIDLPPEDVDINVHPTKREVRVRSNAAVKTAIMEAIGQALKGGRTAQPAPTAIETAPRKQTPASAPAAPPAPAMAPEHPLAPAPEPVQVEFAIEPDSSASRPWQWFKFLAQLDSGYLLIETDMGVIIVNPEAAMARIAYEKMLSGDMPVQPLLIPATVRLSAMDAMRMRSALEMLAEMGFRMEEFGRDVFKIDSVPQLLGDHSASSVIETIAHDLADGSTRKNGGRWREELVAKSVAKSLSGKAAALDEKNARRLVEELCACKMPYVSPQGRPIMIFTSTRELDRKFGRA